jgi:transcriptional regulator with XRE-family HTH domain
VSISKTLEVDQLLRRFGQRIRELRNIRGWSQEQFADICGVHRTYMGHMERGEKNVSLTSIVRVSDALGITLSEFFAGLESGESPFDKPRRGRSKQSIAYPTETRNRILSELAAVEKSVGVLKKLAQGEPKETKDQSRRQSGQRS